MLGSWGFTFAGAAAGLLLGASIVDAAADGASGALQIGKERIALKYAFAAMEQDMLAGGDKERVVVLLSDVPVPEELRKASDDWRFWADRQARAGSLHGVILAIDPATAVWTSGHTLTKRGLTSYSQTVSSPGLSSFRFTPAEPIGDRVAGTAAMKEPMSGFGEEDGSWRLEAHFSATVVRRAAVSGTLTGQAALDSPQYKAALAFIEASRKRNLEAIRQSVDPGSREALAEMIANNKQGVLDMFAGMAEETVQLKLTRIVLRGGSADIELADPKTPENKQTLRVVLAGGEWKIAQ